MRKVITTPLLISILFSFQLSAQVKQATSMYAMAASADNQLAWLNIERFDITACKKNADIFNKDHRYILKDDRDKEATERINTYTHDFLNSHFPTSNMACGIAYSKKTNRVYFFPLGKNELCWLAVGDSADPVKNFGRISSGNIHASGNNYSNEDGNISRATMGFNGKGYAITNDGKHLYEFSDEEVPVITDLGALTERSENENRACEKDNWSGDIVGTTDGNLLLVTGNGKVFLIDSKTRETTFLSRIKGLPKRFIVSGAAVDDQNQLIVSGSLGGQGFYKVNINLGAAAGKIKNTQLEYSVSDLTSSNFLTLLGKGKELPGNNILTGNIIITPNPIQGNSFTLLMNGAQKGNYLLRISDQNGKAIANNRFELSSANAVIQRSMPVLPTGIYYFLIYDASNKVIFHDKIMVSN